MRLEAARAAYGAVQLIFPDRLTGLGGVRLSARERRVLRVLGARHLLQAAVSSRARRGDLERFAHGAGGAVDLLHALSMLTLSLASPRWRRLAGVDGAVAASWSIAEFLVTDPAVEPSHAAEPAPAPSPSALEPWPVAAIGTDRQDGAFGDLPTPVDPEAVSDGESQRRDHARLRQEAVAEVTATMGGRSVADIVEALCDALQARGLDPHPEPWLQAVASDAAAGHVYIVDDTARRDAGVYISGPDRTDERG